MDPACPQMKTATRLLGVAVSVEIASWFAICVVSSVSSTTLRATNTGWPLIGSFSTNADHAQRIRRIARQVLQTCQSAAKPRKRRYVDGHRSVEQHARQSIRIELEGACANVHAACHQRACVPFMPQHHALYRDDAIREWPADAHVLPRHQQAELKNMLLNLEFTNRLCIQ